MKTLSGHKLKKYGLANVRVRQWRADEIRPKRAEKLVDILVGLKEDEHSKDEKVAALIELLAGLEDETGTNLRIRKASLRAQFHAFRYTNSFWGDFAAFIVDKIKCATYREKK